MSGLSWNGNNTDEINSLLSSHEAKAEPDSGKLHLVGLGLNTHICVGDTVLVEHDRLGIKRAHPIPKLNPYVTWTGANLFEVDDFLLLYGVRLEIVTERLNVWAGNTMVASLGRGDRITKANGQVVVSRVGERHRV